MRTRTLPHPCRARLLGRYEAFACRWRCAGGVCAIPAVARNPTAGNAAVVGPHQPGEWVATWEGCAGSVPAAPTLSCAESCAHGGCRMRTCTETPSAARAQTGGTRCPSCSGGRPPVPRKLAGRPSVSTAHESGRFQRVSLHKNVTASVAVLSSKRLCTRVGQQGSHLLNAHVLAGWPTLWREMQPTTTWGTTSTTRRTRTCCPRAARARSGAELALF